MAISIDLRSESFQLCLSREPAKTNALNPYEMQSEWETGLYTFFSDMHEKHGYLRMTDVFPNIGSADTLPEFWNY